MTAPTWEQEESDILSIRDSVIENPVLTEFVIKPTFGDCVPPDTPGSGVVWP